MRRVLVPLIVLSLLGSAAATASGDSAGPATLAAGKEKKPRCKKGYVRKRRHGKYVCVKAKPAFTPHPGLDILANPGTYKGSNGVTVTSSMTPEGGHLISMTIVFPSGNVSCSGRPPYPSAKITVADMSVSDLGSFAGSSSAGANAQIEGHFTGPNTLVLDNAGAREIHSHGQICAAQYSSASIAF